MKILFYYLLHNSSAAFCELVNAPSNDFSTELSQSSIILVRDRAPLSRILYQPVRDYMGTMGSRGSGMMTLDKSNYRKTRIAKSCGDFLSECYF